MNSIIAHRSSLFDRSVGANHELSSRMLCFISLKSKTSIVLKPGLLIQFEN